MSIQAELDSLVGQLEQSRSVAFQAMQYSSDLGTILLFIEESFSVRTEEQLIDNLLKVMQGMDLEAVAHCYTETATEEHTRTTEITADEIEYIDSTRGQHRIASEGTVTVFNYDHISCLVRDMPVADPERYGTLKDTIATLLNGVEARMREIRKDLQVVATQNKLLELTNQSVEEIRKHFSNLNSEANNVLSGLMEDMESVVMGLDTSESSESDILHLIDSHISMIIRINDRCKSVDVNFEELRHSVEHIADECRELQEPPPAKHPPTAGGDNASGSVDLF